MGLGNCSHCWDNPCTCGEEYKGWTEDKLKHQIAMLQNLLNKSQSQTQEATAASENLVKK